METGAAVILLNERGRCMAAFAAGLVRRHTIASAEAYLFIEHPTVTAYRGCGDDALVDGVVHRLNRDVADGC